MHLGNDLWREPVILGPSNPKMKFRTGTKVRPGRRRKSKVQRMAKESIIPLEKSRRSPLAREVFPIAKRTFWFSEIPLFLILSGLCFIGTGAAQGPLVITSPLALPNGSVGIPYSATVTASGGNPPYTWSTPNSVLPVGLSLNTSSGLISGTPTFVQDG